MKVRAPSQIPEVFDDDSEVAQTIALGVERSAALVRELMATPVTDIIQPRFLTWLPLEAGLIVTTDRGSFRVAADRVEAFCPTLGAMVRAEFRAEWSAHGNC